MLFKFDEHSKPVPPFVLAGRIWITGWDIPIMYVIDADLQCWKDDAHGGALEPVTAHALLSTSEREHDERMIRKALGMKPKLPGWMRTALEGGWKPPDDFVLSEYDED